ncbi:ATPase AAA [Nitrospira sp. KM1]|uniref:replication-associated recombination protein A n=1 Tax=Nitrospira sp. KM1 TaxID=1936990 RepID=UPI0013A79627|nr:replication-associated recombination protein A [Nitrospira sp. KM1]BCA54663.1 ATPase AAA [Nitrospira sp. KM1]
MAVHRDEPDLFAEPSKASDAGASPLAERLRPKSFDDFAGQEELIGVDRPLRKAIESDRLTSVIFWGPPGCGKTTLALLLARHTKAQFVSFSAVTSGIPELREILKHAEHRLATKHQKTVLFVDEIHRFNKAQQDAFLPHVERGTIVLIGATTENPSFEVIAPLLSRSLVVVLHPLGDAALDRILDRALHDTELGLARFRLTVTGGARQRLRNFANGDGRALLTALEYVAEQAPISADGIRRIDEAAVDASLLKKSLRYDKTGEEHYNLISAYIKSMRDSDADGALYWLARMLEGGEDPKFIARRMVIFASEDVGNADSMGLIVATAVAQAVQFVGLPEAGINLAHGTTFLATRAKDNASYVGLQEAMSDSQQHGNLSVPLHLRNAVTPMLKGLQYGKGYRYVHEDPEASSEQEHLPPQLKGRRYYRPKSR